MCSVSVGYRNALGRLGERRAALCYSRDGYDILATNWRGTRGEIDIVALRGDVLVFCEVKTRAQDGYGLPEEAVTSVKQLRLRRLASQWLAASRDHRFYGEIRFDVASVLLDEHGRMSVELIEEAF
ncbi:MAG: YraN family protein [Acidimicrobiales bacterium]